MSGNIFTFYHHEIILCIILQTSDFWVITANSEMRFYESVWNQNCLSGSVYPLWNPKRKIEESSNLITWAQVPLIGRILRKTTFYYYLWTFLKKNPLAILSQRPKRFRNTDLSEPNKGSLQVFTNHIKYKFTLGTDFLRISL